MVNVGDSRTYSATATSQITRDHTSWRTGGGGRDHRRGGPGSTARNPASDRARRAGRRTRGRRPPPTWRIDPVPLHQLMMCRRPHRQPRPQRPIAEILANRAVRRNKRPTPSCTPVRVRRARQRRGGRHRRLDDRGGATATSASPDGAGDCRWCHEEPPPNGVPRWPGPARPGSRPKPGRRSPSPRLGARCVRGGLLAILVLVGGVTYYGGSARSYYVGLVGDQVAVYKGRRAVCSSSTPPSRRTASPSTRSRWRQQNPRRRRAGPRRRQPTV